MTSQINFDAWMIVLSMGVVLASYFLICYQDRSWLNWATSSYFTLITAIFIFPLLSLVSIGPTGSTFAYFFCFTTYALTNLCLAVAYVLTRRIPQRNTEHLSTEPYPATFFIGRLPWVLLAIGIAFYAPMMIKFSSLLLHPREIYAQSKGS